MKHLIVVLVVLMTGCASSQSNKLEAIEDQLERASAHEVGYCGKYELWKFQELENSYLVACSNGAKFFLRKD